MLRFSDGVNMDTSGKWRIVRLPDGYYVAGHDMMIPVNSREEGEKIIAEMEEE